jgi:tetratricopeptide (TPR) repeat protein
MVKPHVILNTCHTGVLLISLFFVGCTRPEIQVADQLAAQDQWDSAVAAYREQLKKDPFNATIQQRLEEAKGRAAAQHYTEGRQHLKENRLPEALHQFKWSLSLDPSKAEYQTAFGDALRLQEAHEHALAAEKLHGLGRLDEALDAYERAVQLNPSLNHALEQITTPELDPSVRLLLVRFLMVTIQFR